MSHSFLQDLLGAHALDALDPDETETIERHIRDCPRCRAELDGHREVAGMLGYASGLAPVGLWARITARFEQPPPPLRLARIDRQAAPLPSAVRSQPNPAFALRSRLHAWVIAVLAVAAVTIAALAVQVVHLEDRTSRLSLSRTGSAIQTAALTAAAQEDARHATLRSADGKQALETAILPDGTGFVLKSDLPRLPKSQTYQLWGVDGGDRISLGLLGSQPQVSMFRAESGVTGLVVTAEQAGGVVTSTSTPVVEAWLGTSIAAS